MRLAQLPVTREPSKSVESLPPPSSSRPKRQGYGDSSNQSKKSEACQSCRGGVQENKTPGFNHVYDCRRRGILFSQLNYVEYLLLEIMSNSFAFTLQTIVESSSALALQPLDLSPPMDLAREDSKEEEKRKSSPSPRLLRFRLNPSMNNPLPTSWQVVGRVGT